MTSLSDSLAEPRQNPARTAAHLAALASRRARLGVDLERFLSPGSAITLEVGAGHGHFLTAYAAAHPQKTCLGVDLLADRVARARRKRDRARLANLQFLQGEARMLLEVLPANVRLGEVFVLFPDPWPKLRHHKHRILQREFLSAAAQHATPDVRLYFRTDHAAYFESARELTAQHPAWQIAAEPWPFEFTTVFQSRAAEFHSFIARLRSSS